MEVVRTFNNELSSLYEVKPPISKAKMTQITKSAIKGIKFYKHIVQSVEKFIQKCRPEYKVPGLYVVDSIVRQSRHQFGADKDVFGPRFVKNINITFQHLFKCAEDDRPKIIRVLNLWQKNSVFPSEIIQPLLDMGHPNSTNEWPLDAPADSSKESPHNKVKEESRHKSSDSWKGWPQGNEEPVQDNKTYAEMSTKNLEKFTKAEMTNAIKEDESSRSAMHRNQGELNKAPEETVKFNKKLLDFDYGDEEDEEDVKNEESHLSAQPNALALSMAQNLLSNPELLRQLQQMTASTIQQTETMKDITIPSHAAKVEDTETTYPQEMQSSPQLSLIPPTSYQQPVMPHNLHLSKSETDTDDRVLPEQPLPTRDLDERSLASVMASHDRLLPSMCLPAYQQTGVTPKPPLPDKDDRMIPDATLPPRDLDERSLASIIAPSDRAAIPAVPYPDNSNLIQYQFDKNGVAFQTQPVIPTMDMSMNAAYPAVIPPDQHLLQNSQADEDERVMYSMPGEPPLPPQDFDERQIMIPVEERSRKDRSRSRSGSRNRGRSGRHRSRSRSPRRKRSRSRSRSRKNRSRSRERERIREKERERERERERRRKGIPPIRKGCISVCSTTLWLGHVPKSCAEADISETFEPFGTILSIDMIPPRGCAYVVMDRRQDGYRALQKLKNLKLHGSSVKMAWAPGKGVKGKEFKEYWEVDLGVSYVPYDKVKEDPETLDLLEEGGFIDEDSLPEQLKTLRKRPEEEKLPFNTNNKTAVETNPTFSEIQAAPNMVPPPIMPPTSVGLPMVLPHLMTPQFGLHLPGMLPPQAMVMQVPMGIPPPAPMLMVQQQSQGIMGNQPLSIVGGVPQMVPRTIPTATTALPNLKSAVSTDLAHASPAILPSTGSTTITTSTTVGDATPTEEDGTSVSSPNVQMTVPATVSVSSVPVASTQPIVSMAQFNPALGLTSNRSLLSVPPPVSTTGTPIPYPPPNVGFNFPPPGMRPPGQTPGLPQFSWMQKQVGSPFTDADSGHSANSAPVRPVPPPQPGMPLHLFSNRPPFHDPQMPNVNLPLMKSKGRENTEQKAGEADNSGNKTVSPSNHDKSQEMVISTDDESSMDVDYPRADMPPGPYFPGGPEFSRAPLNMQRMRSPLVSMQPGPRFPRGMHMGSPFPMRMGGPRGMGGPAMHNRMDMEFSPHHGPRGPRIPMGPHGPRRNDNMHPPHDGRDWYPRDFEGPPYDRERDRRYRDDWGREPWATPGEAENDPRRNPRDHEEGRRDDHRESWGRDRTDNSRPSRDSNSTNDRNDSSGKQRETNDRNDSSGKQRETNDRNDSSGKQRETNDRNDSSGKQRETNDRNDSSGKQRETNDRNDSSGKQRETSDRNDSSGKQKETNDRSDSSGKQKEANDRSDSSGKQRERSSTKGKGGKSLMNDLLKLRSYQRNPLPSNKEKHIDQLKDQPIQRENKDEKESDKPREIVEPPVIEKNSGNDQNMASKRERDREYRKRSRWGRTLSEEREFQQQKRNEIEMKFQSYEQSHAAQQPVPSDVEIPPSQNSDETPTESAILPEQNAVEPSEAIPVDPPEENLINPPGQDPASVLDQNPSDISSQNIETSDQSTEVCAQPVIETIALNITSSKETNELTDFQPSIDLDTGVSQIESESLNSSKVIATFSHETDVVESQSTCVESQSTCVESQSTCVESQSTCVENVTDLNENGGVSNCTFNENELAGEVNSNNSSLIPAES